MEHATLSGNLVIVGFGSIGQGVLPLIRRHIGVAPERITIVTAEEMGHEEAERYGIRFVVEPLTRENYRAVLDPLLGPGDFLLNLSVDVSSVALIEFCQEQGALYLDTCIEPWPGGYTDPDLTPSQRSNYALRDSALALRTRYPAGPAAVLTHGANPGIVSHFVKEALLDIARDAGVDTVVPKNRREWANLAYRLGVKVIHIAERDTQVAGRQPKRVGEFVNTWSIDGFVGEGCQPAELGWGTHENHFPEDGRLHGFGCGAAIYLERPGAGTRVRTWTPLEGPFLGFLVTHNESISIADYFTVHNGHGLEYRPTVHYAYHPCDDALGLPARYLRVTLGDVDDLHPQAVSEVCPFPPVLRHDGIDAGIAGDVEQCFLDEMRDDAGVGAVGEHRRRAGGIARAQGERAVPQRIVGALRRREVGIRVPAGPRLDAGVEIERALFLAELDQRHRRDVDREVEEEVAGAEQRVQHRAVVLAGQRLDDKPYAVTLRLLVAHVLRGDDRDPFRGHADVAANKRQYALTDATETDDHQIAGESRVFHCFVLLLE